MRRIAIAVALVVFLFAAATQAQTPAPKPPAELETLEFWIGDWTIEGQARNSPSEPECKLTLRTQCRWIVGGFFLEAHHTWKTQRGDPTSLEIIGYDPSKKHYVGWGFRNGGGTWAGTATFEDGTWVISATFLSADGRSSMKGRNTITFSPDRMSLSLKGEREKDGTWWTSSTAKGVKAKAVPKGQ